MDNNSSTGKNELIETMFKSLNSYTNDLQQELEMINGKLQSQIELGKNFEISQEKCKMDLQEDLIEIRATIETQNVKRSILDRNLTERTAVSKTLQDEILAKRQEQTKLIDLIDRNKLNHHRTIAKISEQCANLTMAFRTNYHAYARADFEEIRKKSEERLQKIVDEVKEIETSIDQDRDRLNILNEKLQHEIVHWNCLKGSMEMITKKIRAECDEAVELNDLENYFSDLKASIDELEAWHRRTNYPTEMI